MCLSKICAELSPGHLLLPEATALLSAELCKRSIIHWKITEIKARGYLGTLENNFHVNDTLGCVLFHVGSVVSVTQAGMTSAVLQRNSSGHSHNLQIPPKLLENKYEKELEKSNGLDFFPKLLEQL